MGVTACGMLYDKLGLIPHTVSVLFCSKERSEENYLLSQLSSHHKYPGGWLAGRPSAD